ncbi:anaerobic sulfatase-maturation protein [soil metagenome]|nr:radical SAM protein [Gemmatimonadota bacterium]
MVHSVILKSIRACNLRCTYCYYINEDTPEYGLTMSDACLERVYASYAEYLHDNGARGSLVWHGGEPLMLGRPRLQRLLDLQRRFFAPGSIENHLQTNGLLITDEWIDFFKRNDVKVGLSLDGTKEVHDRFRVTKGGKGSYDLVIRAIERLRGHGIEVGVLTVMGSTPDGRRELMHLRDELRIRGADFLFPISSHALARRSPLDQKILSEFLLSAFQTWTEADDSLFTVRLFRALIKNAMGMPHNYFASGAASLGAAVIVETDGKVCMDTDFSEIDRYDLGSEYRFDFSVMDEDFTFAKVDRALHARIEERQLDRIPADCQSCRMRSVCRGAHPASRYDDRDHSFDHRSVYCEAMYDISDAVVEYLVRSGHGEDLADADLQHDLRTAVPA